MSVLVTGGAGYIGSLHDLCAARPRREGRRPPTISPPGTRSLVGEKAVLVEGDAGDQKLVRELIAGHRDRRGDPFRRLHRRAGFGRPPRSSYYANNTGSSRALIEACVEGGVKNFIFSSTATVYDADTDDSRSPRTMPKIRSDPYARSKLNDGMDAGGCVAGARFPSHGAALFHNVAGARPPRPHRPVLAARHHHLIKRAAQAALGRVPHLDIFGTDYPTRDGTGVRDYIHVSDLVDAHLLALDALARGLAGSSTFNCGVRPRHQRARGDAGEQMEQVIGRKLPVREGPRRPGDPPELIADPTRIKTTLGLASRATTI